MRLTNQHKENLYNIIVSNLTDPSRELVKEIQAKLQQWVFKVADPSFEDYFKSYGSIHRQDIIYSDKYNIYTYQGINITLITPVSSFFGSTWLDLPTTNVNSSVWVKSVEKYPELDWLEPMMKEAFRVRKEYKETLDNLKTIINACNTDMQLKEMYPDFQQFFSKAGIVTKENKQLPITLGLSDNLVKYGLKLTSKELIEERTKEEMKND